MKRKFLIVNNGVTRHRGHYLENALAVAEDARSQGLDVVLAVHANLPPFEKPGWLECLPIFRVNNWDHEVASPVAGLFGLRGSQVAIRQTTLERVLGGEATLTDYLLARFDPPPQFAPPPVAPRPSPRGTVPFLKAALRQGLPPVLFEALRALYYRRYWLKVAARALTPPAVWTMVRRVKAGVAAIGKPRTGKPGLPAGDMLRTELARIGCPQEFHLMQVFQEDLERLLCLTDAGPEDHVYFPAAHGREAVAVRRLVHALGEDGAPTFHLKFILQLADLDSPMEGTGEDLLYPQFTRIARTFFDHCGQYPESPRLHMYAETEELQVAYRRLTGRAFGLQPLHFRPRMVQAPIRRAPGPLRILYLGDIRETKGFHLLPALVQSLTHDYLLPGKARFIVQAAVPADAVAEAMKQALTALKACNPEHVEIVDGFLPPATYYHLLAESDLVLCPYDARNYMDQGSGILPESTLAGKPTIVPAGTWLERQQGPATGQSFGDFPGLVYAVRKVLDDYPAYRARALAWRAVRVKQMQGTSQVARMIAGGAARMSARAG